MTRPACVRYLWRMHTTSPTDDALAGAAQSTSDPDAIVTPIALRRSVLAALAERAALGDHLAEGAARVIRHLEQRVNDLAWASVGRVCPTCDGDVAHPGVEPCTDCGAVCIHEPGCRESHESCAARDARADREYAWWVEQQDRRRKGGE